MQATSRRFKDNAREALQDPRLQQALGRMKVGFVEKRARAVAALPEFDRLRDEARDIKNHVLANLDFYLERFEARVVEAGGHVHWCRPPAEARDAVLAICRGRGPRTVTKGRAAERRVGERGGRTGS